MIPNVGDEYFVGGFSIVVARRAFEASDETMSVTLYPDPDRQFPAS